MKTDENKAHEDSCTNHSYQTTDSGPEQAVSLCIVTIIIIYHLFEALL